MNENRIYERVECKMDFGCKHYYTSKGEPFQMKEPIQFEISNLSIGGLMAKSNLNLEEDAILEYTFYLESIPYSVMSRVKWVKQDGESYCYGMEFLTISNMLYRHLKTFTQKGTFLQMEGVQCHCLSDKLEEFEK